MGSTKPYKAHSLKGAQREVRRLRKQLKEMTKMWEECHQQTIVLAKLAAKGPTFFNPLELAEAKKLRDAILRLNCKLNPDGSFIQQKSV